MFDFFGCFTDTIVQLPTPHSPLLQLLLRTMGEGGLLDLSFASESAPFFPQATSGHLHRQRLHRDSGPISLIKGKKKSLTFFVDAALMP